jgi:hypothetical protein
MAVLEVLPKVIGTEEFLGLVTLPEFVHVMEMFSASLPICRRRKFVTTIAADVGRGWMDG